MLWTNNTQYYSTSYKQIIEYANEPTSKYLFYPQIVLFIFDSISAGRHSNNNLYNTLPDLESILACLLAAASSIFSLGIPEATAFAMPPISSICMQVYNTVNYNLL